MSKLESLKITECPAAFAAMAEKHNRLVDLIASIEGAVVSENNIVVGMSAQDIAQIVSDAITANTAGLNDKIYDIANTAAHDEFDSVISTLQTDVTDAQTDADTANTWIAGTSTQAVGTCDPGGTITVVTR